MKGILLFLLAMLLPVYAAASDSSSTLNNQSDAKTGYYLVQDWIWGQGCVVAPVAGKNTIRPGQSAQLTIKDGCKWGGVRYKIFNLANNENIGTLSHSFHDGSFSIEISAPCSGTTCVFHDLNPQQSK